ncbi:TPA: hypothetical protein QIR73_002113 [Enterobacter cloacae]|nr:hypothetical protein [Enterobacter cloacae]
MNFVFVILAACAFGIAFGITGGVFLRLWETGYYLQPQWCLYIANLALLVFIIRVYSIFAKKQTFRAIYNRCMPALGGIIIVPLLAGMFYLDIFSSGITGSVSDDIARQENLKKMVALTTPYMSLVMNILFIILEAVIPLWKKVRTTFFHASKS